MPRVGGHCRVAQGTRRGFDAAPRLPPNVRTLLQSRFVLIAQRGAHGEHDALLLKGLTYRYVSTYVGICLDG